MKKLISALLCLTLPLAAASVSLAQTPTWSQFQVLAGVADERHPQVIKAPDGSFYIAATVFDSETEVQHLDSTGTPIWMRVLPGYLRSFDANNSGAVVATENPTYIAVTDGRPDYRVLSLSNAGSLLWSVRILSGVTVPIVRLDGAGNVFLTGALATPTNGSDVYAAKYNTAGGLVWSNSHDFVGDDVPQGMQVDGTGFTVGVHSVGVDPGTSHAILLRYGFDGTIAWQNSINTDSDAVRCFIDASGNNYLAYQTQDPAVFVRKADGNGNTQWTSSHADTEGGVFDIQVPTSGNVYVVSGNKGNLIKFNSSGAFQWTVAPNNPATGRLAFDSSENIFEPLDLPLKYDLNGNLSWTASFMAATAATGVAIDGSNVPFAVGTTLAGNDNDVVLAKLNAATGAETTRSQQDLGKEATAAVSSVTDSSGNTYTYTVRSNTFGEGIPNPVRGTSLNKYNSDGTLLWAKSLSGTSTSFLTLLPSLGVLVVDNKTATAFDVSGNQLWTVADIGGVGRAAAADGSDDVFIATGANTGITNASIVRISAVGALSPGVATQSGLVTSMAVDSTNNVYVCGTEGDVGSTVAYLSKFDFSGNKSWEWNPSDASVTFINQAANRVVLFADQPAVVGTYEHLGETNFRGFLASINSSGVQQWIAEPSGAYQLSYVAKSTSNDYYVSGGSNNAITPHLAVAKVNSGTVIWSKSYSTTQKEIAVGLSLDTYNNVLVPAIGGRSGTGDDVLIVGFSPNGNFLYPSTGGSYFDSGWKSIDRDTNSGSDSTGNLYLSGRSFAPNGIESAHVIKFGVFRPTNGAQFVSQVVPGTMTAGQSYPVTITMKNTGLSTWTSAAGFQLDSVEGSLWGVPNVALDGGDSIAPGQTKAFSFNVTAPAGGGPNAMQWRMEKSGTQFGEPSNLLNISATSNDNAQFIQQVVATSFAPGATFTAKVTMKNTGLTTWTQAGGYCLLSVNPTNNKTWGTNRLLVPSSANVAPNSSVVLFNTLTAPLTPGTYNMQWQMYRNGTLFGDQTTNLQITVAADNAQYLSEKQILSLAPGQAFNMNVLMKNTGQSTWRQVDGFALISQNPYNNTIWGTNRLLVPSVSTVAPNQTVTCSNALHAPSVPGTYNMRWQMYHNGQVFGDLTANQAIVVQNPGDAQYISNVIPTSVKAGSTFTAKVTMKNTGTTTWTQASGYSMISQDTLSNTRWGTNRLLIPSSASVVPGAQILCFNTMTAPSTPGTYPMQWQMYCNGTVFGDLTPIIMITVTP